MTEMTPEATKAMLLSERAKGNVVLLDLGGFHSCPVSVLVDQPADGLLYDLNRLEEVALTFLPKDSQWVNNFAVALVIRELKSRIEALERERDELLCGLVNRGDEAKRRLAALAAEEKP